MTSKDIAASVPTQPTTGTTTFRHPPYAYIHLALSTLTPPSTTSAQTLDAVTVRSHLTSALQTYLGITGAAIQIDILKVEGSDFWIRVPRDDAEATLAAVSQWSSARDSGVAMRVKGRGSWLGGVMGREVGRRAWEA